MRMKRIVMTVLSLMALTVACSQTHAASNSPGRVESRLYGMVEYFEWKENNDDGSRLLKETGPLGGIGGEVNVRLVQGLWVELKPEVYAGEVDYDGQLQDGTPVKSNTSYVGFKGSLDLAYRIPVARRAYIKPFAGIGGHFWTRSLDKSLGDEEVGPNGYDERWKTVYGICGIGAGGHITSRLGLFGTLGLYLPVWNENDVDLSENGGPSSIKIEPGK